MTDDQIEQLAQRVAQLILNRLQEGIFNYIGPEEEEEEELLAELARCMTLLDKYLKEEKYEKCQQLKDKITQIEQKLKNL
jgi:protein-arginine kinase activator protein McsA|tara:strand:+ start:98 stop:337 length:240 start_codon:yes stop_codon:yes gene_type:complete